MFFQFQGRGTVATGRVESGVLKLVMKLKSLVLEIQKNLFVLVLKCLENF